MDYIISELNENSNNNFIVNNLNEDCLENLYSSNINLTINYEQYKINELLRICDYYNFDKKKYNIKTLKKKELILLIKNFEELSCNEEMVSKRLTNWYFINELLKDYKMKKYIIW